MALMTWNDALSTGVRAMDEQHKTLVNTLNDLHAATLAGKNGEVTGPLLGALVKYTHDHFRAEEALLTRAKFPGLAEHCAKHKALTDQVQRFVERYERGELAINVDLLMFLRDWLSTHIQKEDRTYGPWVSRQAIN